MDIWDSGCRRKNGRKARNYPRSKNERWKKKGKMNNPDLLSFPVLLIMVGGLAFLFLLGGLFHKGTPKPEDA